jgi:hypothetical protein
MKYLSLVLLFIGAYLNCNNKIQQKVLLCGVCYNVNNTLAKTINIFGKLGSFFEDYRVIVYQNNSTDGTNDRLNKWSQNNPKVSVISESISYKDLSKLVINRTSLSIDPEYKKRGNNFFKPEIIAYARNEVLKRAFSSNYEEYQFLIWIDMDFVREPDYKAFEDVFASNKEWDAIFAYGVDPGKNYWDWYALRDNECPIGSELLGNDWWHLPKKLNLKATDDWYPVYSAFGGCGIYKKSSIRGCWYSGLANKPLSKLCLKLINDYPDNFAIKLYKEKLKAIKNYNYLNIDMQKYNDEQDSNVGIVIDGDDSVIWRMSSFVYKFPSVCEHVPFHASMILNGHDRLFINPRLIFRYGS